MACMDKYVVNIAYFTCYEKSHFELELHDFRMHRNHDIAGQYKPTCTAAVLCAYNVCFSLHAIESTLVIGMRDFLIGQ